LVSAATTFNDSTGDIDPSVGSGSGALDIVSVEVSHTATDIVFALTVDGDIGLTDFGKYAIGIATGGTGTSIGNGWNRPIYLDSPIGGMNVWIGSWVDGGGGAELYSYDGTNWNGPGVLTDFSFTPGTQSRVSFTVAQADLGVSSGDMFYYDVYASGGMPSDSAVDALSNPDISITAWDQSYTSRTNDTGLSDYTLAATADVVPGQGPFAGGNAVLVTNAVPAIGNGADITNVLVGGVAATPAGQGANWVAFVAPATGSAGAKDVVIQSASLGNSTLAGAYTVNPAGEIGGSTSVTKWSAVGDAMVPGQVDAKGANNTIYGLGMSTSRVLYACGSFTNIGGSNCYRVARYDGTNWSDMGGRRVQGGQRELHRAQQRRDRLCGRVFHEHWWQLHVRRHPCQRWRNEFPGGRQMEWQPMGGDGRPRRPESQGPLLRVERQRLREHDPAVDERAGVRRRLLHQHRFHVSPQLCVEMDRDGVDQHAGRVPERGDVHGGRSGRDGVCGRIVH
jgi:hypothetical protein